MLGLAVELRALGKEVVLCVPPTFQAWVESFGFACVPVGPDVRPAPAQRRDVTARPTRAQLRALVPGSVRDQFRACTLAAEGCDLVVVGGALQTAARSIAEHRRLPYVHATYCPNTLPSPHHPPPRVRSQRLPSWINRLLWKASDRSWHRLFGEVLNEQRQLLGLPPVGSVPRYIATERPWVAADRVLTSGVASRIDHVQTGAWIFPDARPLPDALEKFLADGDAPIYFGFGSMLAKPETSRVIVDTVRALGRRAVILQGWGDLQPIDAGADCLSVGDVNHQRLFARVAAVVHHGGAGTTTAAALAGRPQVIVPHLYDQYYWAERVRTLGIGVRGQNGTRLDSAGLVRAVRACLKPAVVEAAQALAPRIERRGARIAAERLVADFDRAAVA
jgi:vancomycin aglycone glucosyltransferase